MENEWKLMVSEPWDFISKDGKNLLLGSILDKNNKYILFKTHSPFVIMKNKVQFLILSPRFSDEDFSQLGHKKIHVNGSCINEENINMSGLESLIPVSNFIIIGSLEEII